MTDSNPSGVTEDLKGNSVSPGDTPAEPRPERIGRYRIEKILGQGGFGRVYLAFDSQLDRQVAVKVPHARLIVEPQDADVYLSEARMVASLDHAHIVPVYDVGSTPECPLYIVSKYIAGTDLATKLKTHRYQYNEAAKIVAAIADALHFAHKQGIVHRDVKPGNILIGKDGRPHLSDFGLALREEDIGKGPKYAGTPTYMSPEQARGEGHRVDGRSDIFSLGVVLYELLAGRRPFRGESRTEVLEQVATYEPRPLRQYDERLPRELERICHKAIAKRASERYSSAHDFATDLKLYLSEQDKISAAAPFNSAPPAPDTQAAPASTGTASTRAGSASDASHSAASASVGSLSLSAGRPIHVIPKGLRAFDAHDADFFLELLPGPRDRQGMPDSLRFWKTLIEETDVDHTFSVGLIYGPSGCGKSSLVKAGLLPNLSRDVRAVYIEATPEETETRLLRGLRKNCAGIGENFGLKESLAALRQGVGIPLGCKVLIVIDQFEQWLHANKGDENAELVQALRQCDGERVQCIVMVRDDFWMAATRLMRDLEVRLVEGQNSAAVDLFPLRHAEKVLAAFGRAYGALPESHQLSKDQKEFLKQSAHGLAEEGKVICVRLALFAEMMKGRPWTPATLKQVGGTKGLGATFLEETFSVSSAPPQHRYHQKAARAVLQALLPESGKDIKGQMKSAEELLQASGYARRTKDFAELTEILDAELRLITPTDPAGMEADDDDADARIAAGEKYYQLTHDYLVHSLRDWLTRKQKETRRGRAELRLADRCSLWSAKPEKRHLPSLWEFCNIRVLTVKKNWSDPQRTMMHAAGRVHAIRCGIFLLVALTVGLVIQQVTSSARRRNLQERVHTTVASMRTSRGPLVPRAIQDLEEFPSQLVVRELRDRTADSNASERLSLAYALARFDEVDVDFLIEQVQQAPPSEVSNLISALEYARDDSLQALRLAAEASEQSKDYRRQARMAILALRLGDPPLAEQMCRPRPDPIQRTIFVETLSSWHGDAAKFAELHDRFENDALCSAVCLGIGSLPADALTAEVKDAWQPILSRWFQDRSDAGSHSAAGWALRKMDWQLPELPVTSRPSDSQDWYVNRAGMTMLRIHAGSVAPAEKGKPPITLPDAYWLADRETTLGRYQRFMEDQDYPTEDKPADWSSGQNVFAPLADHPVQFVNARDIILFCNWLSHQDDLQPCYIPTGRKEKVGNVDVDVWQLRLDANGYRLPTGSEWEYACRAGAATIFPFGDNASFHERYTVYRAIRPELGASKMPNAWGLFDMLGNVEEHCLSVELASASADSLSKVNAVLLDKSTRGGSYFFSQSEFLRSDLTNTNTVGPDLRAMASGFRVVRSADHGSSGGSN